MSYLKYISDVKLRARRKGQLTSLWDTRHEHVGGKRLSNIINNADEYVVYDSYLIITDEGE